MAKDHSMVVPRFAEQTASIGLSATGFPPGQRPLSHSPKRHGRPENLPARAARPVELEAGRYHTAPGKLTEKFHRKLFKNKYSTQE
ncbi:hypothetical protein CN311_04455 [Mesorhizobium sanjuanii]|uniref:Uncharacterized protein n=1 Tax=Mesorhizobium sanjuanii TaxID=2037900 RepID=A0A2A6FK10_9HYPH|nr:hypothetical protein CN311_04455 [Mesorhizobium sanjuanii]